MAKGEVVKNGDLIMWVSRSGIRHFGKVIYVNSWGQVWARKIKQPGQEYDYTQGKRVNKPLRYSIGRQVPDNWTVIATKDAETVDQIHPITKARMDYEFLEGDRKYLF